MAYVFVTVTKLEASSGTSFSGSVTCTAGHALFACSGTSGVSTSPTISGGGTWAKDASGNNGFSASGSISSCPSATGGTQTITTSTTSGGVTCIYEFSGNPSSAIKDATSPAVTTGGSTTITTGSVSNVTPDAVFIAMMVDNSGSNPATVTGTTAGWVYPVGGKETNAASFDAIGSGYKIVSATGTETSSWTIDTSSWAALIAVYKAAAAGVAFLAPSPLLIGQAVNRASTY